MDNSKFVGLAEFWDDDTTKAPCGNLIRIYAGQAQDGTYAQKGNYFHCACGQIHQIVSVNPPQVM